MTKNIELTITSKLTPLPVKLVDVNRTRTDKTPLPKVNAVGFISKSEKGLNVIFNDRFFVNAGDSLYIHLKTESAEDETDAIVESELRGSPAA